MTCIYRFLNKKFKRRILIISSFSILFIILLMNLGRFLDITDVPNKADIIVYLGGGWSERLEKSLQLYKLGYSKTDKIILTGSLIGRLSKEDLNGFYKIEYLKAHGVHEKNIIFAEDTGNTMKEVVFVKNYMLKHRHKSVIFVSDPPHSRRILFLANFINNYDDANLSCIVVGSDADWWNRLHYYKDREARNFVKSEMSKLVHNFIAYGVLQKFGFLNVVRESFGPMIYFFKEDVYGYFVETDQ